MLGVFCHVYHHHGYLYSQHFYGLFGITVVWTLLCDWGPYDWNFILVSLLIPNPLLYT